MSRTYWTVVAVFFAHVLVCNQDFLSSKGPYLSKLYAQYHKALHDFVALMNVDMNHECVLLFHTEVGNNVE
jgi:hypothetical protein